MSTRNLDRILLGPPFETQTAQSFRDYVDSMRAVEPVKVPRVKKAKQFHEISGKICKLCGKRPRKIEGICKGVKISIDALEPAAL